MVLVLIVCLCVVFVVWSTMRLTFTMPCLLILIETMLLSRGLQSKFIFIKYPVDVFILILVDIFIV